eukprot:TRINITY_DN8013_c0_g1_i8.p2 TRINITY_DN8013_c0_g1~~TRINITY_DN8013_c0_g1_i8.p2  ORF type:complete len:414 (+),score=97.18 TRINITY_DN8013_c0_g1_i8:162-1244(+)
MAKGYFLPSEGPPCSSKFFVMEDELKNAQEICVGSQVAGSAAGKNAAGEEIKGSDRVNSPTSESLAIRMEDELEGQENTGQIGNDPKGSPLPQNNKEEDKQLIPEHESKEEEMPVDSEYQGLGSPISSAFLNDSNGNLQELSEEEREFREPLCSKWFKEDEDIRRQQIPSPESSHCEGKQDKMPDELDKSIEQPISLTQYKFQAADSRDKSSDSDFRRHGKRSHEITEHGASRDVISARIFERMASEFPRLSHNKIRRIEEAVKDVNREFKVHVMRNLCCIEDVLQKFMNEKSSEELIIMSPKECAEFELVLHKKYITTYKTKPCGCKNLGAECFGYHVEGIDRRRVPLMFSSSMCLVLP